MTRQDLPRGEAQTVARHSDSIPHPVPLWGDPEPIEAPCWRCRTGTVERDHRGVLPECRNCHRIDDARPDDHETSRAAARQADRGPRSRLARLILADLAEHGPSTDDEGHARHPDELLGSWSKRRGDLVAAGLVRDTGRTRPTRRGVGAVVWEVVE